MYLMDRIKSEFKTTSAETHRGLSVNLIHKLHIGMSGHFSEWSTDAFLGKEQFVI